MNVRGKELKDLKIVENMKTKRKKELNKEDFQEKKNYRFDDSCTERTI